VRCPPLGRTGSYGPEEVNPVCIRRGPAPAEERGVVEAALRIGLPDLEHQVVERAAVGLDHPAGHLDHLTSGVLAKVVCTRRELAREEGAERHLRGGHEPLHGIPGLAWRPRTTSWYS
jgi:hypothetical protein